MLKWDEKKKGDPLVIEDNGKKVRNTSKSFDRSNVVGVAGFSKGIHEWILEFEHRDHQSSSWGIELVSCEYQVIHN